MADITRKTPTKAAKAADSAGALDSFIPESVDQLLAHSRRYPLLTPAQEIELAQKIATDSALQTFTI